MILMGLTIEQRFCTNSDAYKYNSYITPKGIVVHSTAMPGYDAYAIQKNFNVPNRGASVQACCDDKRVVQMLQWNRKAGHVGSGKKGSFNNSHIGIEMCEPSGLQYNGNGSAIVAYHPPAGYFAAIWDNMVKLCAMLCQKYALDPLGKQVIVSHAEACALGTRMWDTGLFTRERPWTISARRWPHRSKTEVTKK